MPQLSIEQIATLAVSWWPDPETAATMTAIGMAESNGNTDAHGDPVANMPHQYDAFASQGYLSWGLWQVFLGAHNGRIQAMTHISHPDEQARWLTDPNNNARAAAAILADQGFNAWSVYKGGQYLSWMPLAKAAVAALTVAPPPPPKPAEEVPPDALAPLTDHDKRLLASWMRQLADLLDRTV